MKPESEIGREESDVLRPHADAEAATLPFLVRAAANLSKYRNTDVDSVFKEHKLDHLRKWKEVSRSIVSQAYLGLSCGRWKWALVGLLKWAF